MKRFLMSTAAFMAGASVMAGIYLGFLSWLEGWDYAAFQFWRDRNYVIPIIVAFGVQSSLYWLIRFERRARARSTMTSGVLMGTNGGTSATAMVACCLHHATNLLPILGISAATAFLARHQREFLQFSLLMNIVGIVVMLNALQRARQVATPVLELS